MHQTDLLEAAICQKLARFGSCSMELLTSQLPDYSWAEVFDAVKRLTRDNTVVIKHPGPCLCLPRSHRIGFARRAQVTPGPDPTMSR
jgi:hypothetical protein